MDDAKINRAWAPFAKRTLEQMDHPDVKRKRASTEAPLDLLEKTWSGGFIVKQVAALERGHAIVDGIRDTLKLFDARSGIKRLSLQVEVNEMFTSAMARIFYGDAYSENEYAIMQRNKWRAKDMNGFCLVQAQRQLGKSTVCAMQAAAVLCNAPNVYGFVIATNFDQACIILNAARDLIKKCRPDIKFKYDNTHEFVLDFGHGDERKFEALPDEERVRFLTLLLHPRKSMAPSCQLRLSLGTTHCVDVQSVRSEHRHCQMPHRNKNAAHAPWYRWCTRSHSESFHATCEMTYSRCSAMGCAQKRHTGFGPCARAIPFLLGYRCTRVSSMWFLPSEWSLANLQ